MRIVLATPLYPPEIGGPATYAKSLAERLPARGIEVDVVPFSSARHLPKLIRHYIYFKKILRAAKKADVILALDPVSVGLPSLLAANRSGKPLILKIVGDYAWEQGRQRFGVAEELDTFAKGKSHNFFVRQFQTVQIRVARGAKRIITPSHYLKNIVAAWGIEPEKISIIYNGIDMPPELPMSQERPEGFLVVSAGRRVPWKGFEALERTVAQEASWSLFIASNLPKNEVFKWIQAADVFVLNSRYEGFSHILLEVMALGTPIIATDAGGNRELITDRETGLLIPPGDDAALMAALKDVEHNPIAARTRATAAKLDVQKFSVAAMLDATAALLTSV